MPNEKDIQARAALATAIQAGGETNRFWAIRGMAIQSYAILEQALGDLFAELSDLNPQIASIIFFKINALVRNPMLEKLFKRKFRAQYNLFRNSLIRLLRPIDIERNEIVHWNVVNHITQNDDRIITGILYLEAPNLWPPDEIGKRWNVDALEEFIEKCQFYAEMVRMFSLLIINRASLYGWTQERHDAWRNIFLQPLIYPPPADHPSRRFQRTPDNPPQS